MAIGTSCSPISKHKLNAGTERTDTHVDRPTDLNPISVSLRILGRTRYIPHALEEDGRIEVVGRQIEVPATAPRESVQVNLEERLQEATYTACIEIAECQVSKILRLV